MKTISSKNSLIHFDRNANKSNVYLLNSGDIRLFLKPDYVSVFRTIEQTLAKNSVISFVDLWHKTCNDAEKNLKKKLQANVKDLTDEDANNILVKFRGNLGEIFAEAFFTNGLASELCDGTTYDPVDPTNERFTDADAESVIDGTKMGIQIKNYNVQGVKIETFIKSAAEDRLRLTEISDKDLYLKNPRQIIFSFTDTMDMFIEDFSDIVIFLGPKYIDSKNIQGNQKLKLNPRWNMFKKIADEIESLS